MIDVIGYLAAGLVLAAFCMRSMSKLRLVALASNLVFIAYGYLDNLMPVLVLHALLLSVNVCRLVQQLFSAQLLQEQLSYRQRDRAMPLSKALQLFVFQPIRRKSRERNRGDEH